MPIVNRNNNYITTVQANKTKKSNSAHHIKIKKARKKNPAGDEVVPFNEPNFLKDTLDTTHDKIDFPQQNIQNIIVKDQVEKREIEKIINDPDFQLDLNSSDNIQLDANINGLFAYLRVALSKIQETQRTNEKVKLTEKQDEIRGQIQQSKHMTQHKARILFVSSISSLALASAAFIPDLVDIKDTLKNISDVSQSIAKALETSTEALLGEINQLINLGNQNIQEIERKAQSISTKFNSVNDSLANMMSSMRVNG